MKRLLGFVVAILLFYSTAVGSQVVSKNLGALQTPITYLLRCFSGTTADQSYTNGQVIDTPAEGCWNGSLTLTGLDGSYSSESISNRFKQGAPSWCGTATYSSTITRSLGQALFYTYDNFGEDKPANQDIVGLFNNVSTCYTACEYGIYSGGVADSLQNTYRLSVLGISFPYSSTDNKIAFVLGGYSSDNVPWKSGDIKSSFPYGARYFTKVAGVWTLLIIVPEGNTSPVYFGKTTYNKPSTYYYNILIPNLDFSSVLQPTFLDTFTDTDSTALSSHTPDVAPIGSIWSGTATITGNTVTSTGAATYGIVNTGLSDFYLTDRYKTPDTAGYNSGIYFREVDGANYWFLEFLNYTTSSILSSVQSSVWTIRATDTTARLDSTWYNLTIVASGTSKNVYVDGVLSVSSTLDLLGAGTGIGVNTKQNNAHATLAVFPLTSTTQYDNAFATVGY